MSAIARLAIVDVDGAGVGAGLEIDFDDAHAGERAGFDVLDSARESKEPSRGAW